MTLANLFGASPDDVVAVATIAVAAVAGVALVFNFVSIRQARRELRLVERQLAGAELDRELSVEPYLIVEAARGVTATSGPGVLVHNIGQGQALQVRLFQWVGDELYWNSGVGLTVAGHGWLPSDPADSMTATPMIDLNAHGGGGSIAGIPGSATPGEDLWAFCVTQIGVRLCFNLRASAPPEKWRPGEVRVAWWAACDQAWQQRGWGPDLEALMDRSRGVQPRRGWTFWRRRRL